MKNNQFFRICPVQVLNHLDSNQVFSTTTQWLLKKTSAYCLRDVVVATPSKKADSSLCVSPQTTDQTPCSQIGGFSGYCVLCSAWNGWNRRSLSSWGQAWMPPFTFALNQDVYQVQYPKRGILYGCTSQVCSQNSSLCSYYFTILKFNWFTCLSAT